MALSFDNDVEVAHDEGISDDEDEDDDVFVVVFVTFRSAHAFSETEPIVPHSSGPCWIDQLIRMRFMPTNRSDAMVVVYSQLWFSLHL